MIEDILLLSSSFLLGLFLGSQVTEAVLLVPYWKSMSADAFFAYYKKHGHAIHRFYAPITIAATVVPLAAAGYGLLSTGQNQFLYGWMGISTLIFFSSFFAFFKGANKSFGERSFADEELPARLQTWGNWHWMRTGFELVAFVCALVLLWRH